jgi:hypothetical protein
LVQRAMCPLLIYIFGSQLVVGLSTSGDAFRSYFECDRWRKSKWIRAA